MKKVLLLVTLSVLFVFGGCLNNTKSENTKNVRLETLNKLTQAGATDTKRAATDVSNGVYLTAADGSVKYYALDYLSTVTPEVKKAFLTDLTTAVKAQFVFGNRAGSLDDTTLVLADFTDTSTKTKAAETEITKDVFNVATGALTKPDGTPSAQSVSISRAINETTIEIKVGNETATVSDFSPKPLTYNAPTTVTFNYKNATYTGTVTLPDPYTIEMVLVDANNKEIAPVAGETVSAGVKVIGTFSTSAALKADGTNIMKVKATIKYKADGKIYDQFTGKAVFESKVGLTAGQLDTIFDNGVAIFNVKMPNSEVLITDVIGVTVLKAPPGKEYLNGKTTGKYEVKYEGKTAGPGTTTSTVYTIDRVESADVADRVKVYIGGVTNTNDLPAIKNAIKTQLVIYNCISNSDAITINDVVDSVRIDDKNNAYAFTALVNLEPYRTTGYTYNANVNNIQDIKLNGTSVLKDNGYNYWEVKKVENGTLTPKTLTRDPAVQTQQKFMLIDGKTPAMAKVEPQATTNFLDKYSILVVFDEAVERKSAENVTNWTLNAKVLEAPFVQYIRTLDYNDNDGLTGKVTPILESIYGKEVVSTKALIRNCVVIKLYATGAAKYFVNGTNVIQVKNVNDWAGVTDHTGNNTLLTQDLKFQYVKPVINAGLDIVMQSPEQYIVTLKGVPLYTDEALTTVVGLDHNIAPVLFYDDNDNLTATTVPDINNLIKVSLTNDDLEKDKVTTFADLTNGNANVTGANSKKWYRILNLNSPDADGNPRYILELTADWTKILKTYFNQDEKPVYHNKFFRVEFTQDIYDSNKDKLPAGKGKTWASVQVPEDTKSPYIAFDANSKKVYEFINKWKEEPDTTAADRAAYRKGYWKEDSADRGRINITMNEPAQLFKIDQITKAVTTTMIPGATPSLQQKDIYGVPVPTFEYVLISSTSTVSQGEKVEGKFRIYNTNEQDLAFEVEPSKALVKGDWRLVVRSISDDVGNTMATEEILFTIGEKDVAAPSAANVVWPYIVWAYAKAGVQDAKNPALVNDYVYILYSRKMDIDAIRAATYNISGKQLEQDAEITSSDYIGYHLGYVINKDNGYTMYYGQKYDKTQNKNVDPLVVTFGSQTITVADKQELVPVWRPQLVTIKLPLGFLQGDNMDGTNSKITNALSVPRTLTAVADGIDNTPENLQFTNNMGNNTYELEFDRKANLTAYTDVTGLTIGNPNKNYYGQFGIVLNHPAFYLNGSTTATSINNQLVVPPITYTQSTYPVLKTAQGYENSIRLSDTDSVTQATSALTLGTISAVTTNLTLPAVGNFGTTVTWTSSDTTVITNSGAVTQPQGNDTTVTLTATVVKGTAVLTKDFVVTVIGLHKITDADAVTMDAAALTIGDISAPVTSAAALTLAATGTNGTTITWETSDATVITAAGAITQPSAGNVVVTLTATIVKNAATTTKTFAVTVVGLNLVKPTISATFSAPIDKILFAQYTATFTADNAAVKSIKLTYKASGKTIQIVDLAGALTKANVTVKVANDASSSPVVITACSDAAGTTEIAGTAKEITLVLP